MKDLTNQRFGRLITICPLNKRLNGEVVWLCHCDCGNLMEARSSCLIRDKTKSCGCFQRENAFKLNLKHGDAIKGKVAWLYKIWISMKQRCLNPKDQAYKWYGKRGISVCAEWLNNYKIFKDWAMANGHKKGLTIDRINSKGNYEPSNCQWITRSENARKAQLNKGK